MDKEELELKEQLRREKKAILEERKRKREEYKTSLGNSKSKNDSNHDINASLKAIYISNLPVDCEIDTLRRDLIREFCKFGDIERNKDNEIKCKLYTNDEGILKGDALIVYCRKEYALLAIEMMHGYDFKGKQLSVEYAYFDEKKTLNKHKITDQDDQVTDEVQYKRKKLTDTTIPNANNESRKERTLVLVNVIDIYQDLESDELQEIEIDLLNGCKSFGSIVSYVLNADKGEFHVTFTHRDEAVACCKIMNGRYFDGRKLFAYILDEENLSDGTSEPASETELLMEENEDFMDDGDSI